MPWCQGPGSIAGQVAGASDDEAARPLGNAMRSKVGPGVWPHRIRSAEATAVAGQRGVDLLGGEVGGEGRVGVPDGGERVAGHAVADVHVALAGAVQRELGRQRP